MAGKDNMEIVHLAGAESVQNAGYAMERAAERMNQAAGAIECSLETQRRWMDAWIERFEAAVEKLNQPNQKVTLGRGAEDAHEPN